MVNITENNIADRESGLTGEYRFRQGWSSAVILEVRYFWTGMPAYSRGIVTEKRWRDAVALDLTDLRLRSLIDGGSAR